ncbi:hypothetical protein LCGC14_0235560 [marine sediment metagenome]|uniref:Uncharacterized protein n=1 Tax=marine sediment metagenome TaxID=412755 RepID=A0A0F9U8Z8_9ZZZZ
MTTNKLQQTLKALRIPFQESTKCLNINCPFCVGKSSGRRDDKFRCGIFPNVLRYYCFRCHRKGSFYDILSTLLGYTRSEYARTVDKAPDLQDKDVLDIIRENLHGVPTVKAKKADKIELPPSRGVTPELVGDQPLLRQFLVDRGISLRTCSDYMVRYTGVAGQHAQRLIIPIYDDNQNLVAWQGRDVSSKAKLKYFTNGPIMDYLYWTVSVEPPYRIYLVEGAIDCWRMGHNAVTCFSKQLTRGQRAKLVTDDYIKELVLCWDSDAYNEARGTALDLAPIMRTGVVRLPEGEDPDSLGAKAVRELDIEWLN